MLLWIKKKCFRLLCFILCSFQITLRFLNMDNYLDSEMVMPLNLNFLHKTVANPAEDAVSESHHSPSESTSPAKKLLGPTQAKKRLQAFAQQWTKTKENMESDKALEKRVNENGTLKYTYLVEREDGKKISFPAHLIRYTTAEPPISFCCNPHFAVGAFESRKEVLDRSSQEEKQVMYFIMNSSSPSCGDKEFPGKLPFILILLFYACNSDNEFIITISFYSGRYRKWYANRRSFVGKPEDQDESSERYSPHWESDSEEEELERPPSAGWNLLESASSSSRLLTNPIKLVSKVKINKVELPFFDDEDFVESLLNAQKSEPKTDQSSNDKLVSDGDPSQGNQISTSISTGALDWSFEDEDRDQRPTEKRRRSTPDWDEEWRSSSRYQNRRTKRDSDETKSKRSRRRSPQRDGKKARRSSSRQSPRNKDEADVSMASEEWAADSNLALEEDLDGGVDEASDSKRLSLDQRLELELGIKIESETLQASLSAVDQRSLETSPVKR